MAERPAGSAPGRAQLESHLAFVFKAGHGEVLIKVADGVIVHIESKAIQDLTRKERTITK